MHCLLTRATAARQLHGMADESEELAELRMLMATEMVKGIKQEGFHHRELKQAQALAASKQPEQANARKLTVYSERPGASDEERCLLSNMRMTSKFELYEHYTMTNISPTGADYNPTERQRTTTMVNCPGCNMRRAEDGRAVPKRDANGEPLDPLENQQGHIGGCLPEID